MSRPHVVTSSELQSLRDLELMTKATVEGLRQGLHRSPFHGYSAEFSQYRHYRPGDDLKYVDWKAFARTDRIYTRQFRETTNLSALFVIDVSRSMDFRGRSSSWRARSPRPRHAGARSRRCRRRARGRRARALRAGAQRHHHLRVFLAELASLQPRGAVVDRRGAAARGGDRQAARPGARDFGSLRRRSGARARSQRLARMGHDVIVIHTLAREELTLDVGGAAEFVDLESGRKLMVQPSAARESYVAAITAWLSHGRAAAAARGHRLPAVDHRRSARAGAAAISGRPARLVVAMSIVWIAPAALLGLGAGRAADRHPPAGATARAHAGVSVAAFPA